MRPKAETLAQMARMAVELDASAFIPYTDEGEALADFYYVVKWFNSHGYTPIHTVLHAQSYEVEIVGHGRIWFDGPNVYRNTLRMRLLMPRRKEK